MFRNFLLSFCILIFNLGLAQTKYEKEVRIKATEAPVNALNFIESLEFNRKVRWYKEFGLDKTSVEAKTKYQGKKYSVEFSNDGSFEDMEVQIGWREMATSLQNKIDEYLRNKYGSYKIEKIQIQFIGDLNVLRPIVKEWQLSESLNINYELVINTKIEKSFKRFELLFSEDGEMLSTSEIVLKNRDNIEF